MLNKQPLLGQEIKKMNINESLNVLGIDALSVTKEELKKAYKKAAQKYHPDRNPQGENMMKIVNEAYDFLKELDLDTIERSQNKQGSYDIYDFGELINNALNTLAGYDDLILEIIGNWLWIRGNTKEHREMLKELNCKYAPKKQIWYFRPEEHRCKVNNKEHSLEEIRNSYSSWTGKAKTKQALQHRELLGGAV